MIDQVIMMTMQLIQQFSEKRSLAEFEHELYENACRMTSSHCKSVRLMNELNILELESDLSHRQDYKEENQNS